MCACYAAYDNSYSNDYCVILVDVNFIQLATIVTVLIHGMDYNSLIAWPDTYACISRLGISQHFT